MMVLFLLSCVFPSTPKENEPPEECVPPFCLGDRFDDSGSRRDTGWRDTGWRDTGDHRDTGDVDVDVDVDADLDTGVALMYYLGDAQVIAGEFQAGHFGSRFYGVRQDDFVCQSLGDFVAPAAPAVPCPGCTWAFDLKVANSQADGDFCADFGVGDGMWDGIDYGWGYAPTYQYQAYTLTNVIVLLYGGYWTPFFFNYGGEQDVTGDAEDVSFTRLASDQYYYYYL